MARKMSMQTQMTQYLPRIATWCIRQQNLASWQTTQDAGEMTFGPDHGCQIVETMCLAQKIVGLHLVMLYHAEQRSAVTLPISDACRVNCCSVARLVTIREHTCNIGVHIQIDRRENRMRSIMQRIVEIKQPGQFPLFS